MPPWHGACAGYVHINNSKQRRRHTAEQKAELLRQHVAEKKPVSEVCNEAGIQPSLFCTWQRELLAGADTVFSSRRTPSREKELEEKISRLEAKVARKDQTNEHGNTLSQGFFRAPDLNLRSIAQTIHRQPFTGLSGGDMRTASSSEHR